MLKTEHSAAAIRSVIVKTPAKINLFLAIRGKRADGMHELESVFLPLPDLCDTITVTPIHGREPEITCSHPQVPVDSSNLVYQAAIAFAEEAKIPPAWHIHIDKKIPVAAGLGGGSSDGAAVLNALEEITGITLGDSRRHQMARQLGADAPFFLNPLPSLARGIGDKLDPVTLNCSIPILLLNPGGLPVSAGWAYQRIRGSFDDLMEISSIPLLKAMWEGDLEKIARNTRTRFNEPLLQKIPLLQMFFDFLRNQDSMASHVSGSGPTVFAVFNSEEQAAAAALKAEKEFSGNVWTWHGAARASKNTANSLR